MLVGFSGSDDVAAQAAWDLRYQYLAGPLGDPAAPCSANGAWWGCWQDWSQPPGQYVTGFVATAARSGQVPMITYYLLLPASGAGEGGAEVAAVRDPSFMARYLDDWRFLLSRIGSARALLHVEPDFWGFAQHVSPDAHAIPAAVSAANPTDCADQEDSVAGLGHCMIVMVRRYAPNAKVGLHASAWGSGVDVSLNASAALDVRAEAAKVAAFLLACGAGAGDFVAVDASDRDAGYYQSLGRDTWWDATNATLPSFHQALAWSGALAEAVAKPVLWWQVPVGNAAQAETPGHWRDNRVEYFFEHPAEFASAHVLGIAFGAGAADQTGPATDGGYLVSLARAYFTGGGTPACP